MSTGLGDRIKKRRTELGWSQEELARQMGLKSKSTICKIEKGEDNLTTTAIRKYADALQTTPSVLMGWEDNRIDSYYSSQEYYDSLTDEEKYLIETFRDMSAKTKEAFIEYGEYLSQRDIQKG